MARGWESKSVESQIESASSSHANPNGNHLTPEQLQRLREREGLELSRTRVLHDLNAATHQRYRESLELALKFLEDKIAALR
jgi:hypothetical protein